MRCGNFQFQQAVKEDLTPEGKFLNYEDCVKDVKSVLTDFWFKTDVRKCGPRFTF